MKSIPTIFLRDRVTRQVENKKLMMCKWVFDGKGTATRKYDGVAIKIEGNKVWRRFEWVEGEAIPMGFVKVQDADPKRPHLALPGWVPVPETFKTNPSGKDERYLRDAWNWLLKDLEAMAFNNKKAVKIVNQYAPEPAAAKVGIPNGTYELCGPDVHGNHDKFKGHVLIMHGACLETPTTITPVKKVPRDFEGLKTFLETYEGEGIVWHYIVGNTVTPLMAKIKRRDFGYMVRLSKEDKEMAYRKDIAEAALLQSGIDPATRDIDPTPVHMPPPELQVVSDQEAQNSGFASVFEPGNSNTGDDIHLEDPILAQL